MWNRSLFKIARLTLIATLVLNSTGARGDDPLKLQPKDDGRSHCDIDKATGQCVGALEAMKAYEASMKADQAKKDAAKSKQASQRKTVAVESAPAAPVSVSVSSNSGACPQSEELHLLDLLLLKLSRKYPATDNSAVSEQSLSPGQKCVHITGGCFVSIPNPKVEAVKAVLADNGSHGDSVVCEKAQMPKSPTDEDPLVSQEEQIVARIAVLKEHFHEELKKEFDDDKSVECSDALEYRLFIRAAAEFGSIKPEQAPYTFKKTNDAKNPDGDCHRYNGKDQGGALYWTRINARKEAWLAHGDKSPANPNVKGGGLKPLPSEQDDSAKPDAPGPNPHAAGSGQSDPDRQAAYDKYVPSGKNMPAMDDLSKDEAVALFGLENTGEGLYGNIYTACVPLFQLKNTANDAELQKYGAAGVRIIDKDGHGRECERQIKETCSKDASKDICATTMLSKLSASKFDIGSFPDKLLDGELLLCRENTKKDTPNPFKGTCESLPTVIPFKSKATRVAEEEQAQANQAAFNRARGIKILSQADCFATPEGQAKVIWATTVVAGLNLQAIKEKLDLGSHAILQKSCADPKGLDPDGSVCEQNIDAWAGLHPDDKDQETVAMDYVALSNRVQDLGRKRDILRNALALDVSKKTKFAVNFKMTDDAVTDCEDAAKLGTGRDMMNNNPMMAAMMPTGMMGNAKLNACGPALQQQLLAQVQKDCRPGNTALGSDAATSPQVCAAAMGEFNRVNSLYAVAQRADLEKAAFQRQMMASMYGQQMPQQPFPGQQQQPFPGQQQPFGQQGGMGPVAFGGPNANMMQQAMTPTMQQNPYASPYAAPNPYANPYANPYGNSYNQYGSNFNGFGAYGGAPGGYNPMMQGGQGYYGAPNPMMQNPMMPMSPYGGAPGYGGMPGYSSFSSYGGYAGGGYPGYGARPFGT